jgi:hypothetical protein
MKDWGESETWGRFRMRGDGKSKGIEKKGSVNKFDFDYAQGVFCLFNKSSKALKAKKLLMVGWKRLKKTVGKLKKRWEG